MFSKLTKGGTAVLVLVAVLAIALMGGCSSKSVKDDDQSAATTAISISASPSTVTVNASTVVEATVTAGTAPVAGQTVHFAVQPSGNGYFTPESAVTGSDGVAATVYTATSTGAIVLSATTEFADGAKLSSTGVNVTEDQQSASGNVTITVTPNLLLANGVDTCLVTITARDGLGQPVANGTTVTLVAGEKFVDEDANGIFTYGIDSLVYDINGNGTWDAMGQIPSSVQVAGGAGQAQATYVAGNSAGTAYIKATVADETIGGSADRAVQLSPDAKVNSIYLSSDSLNLVVKGTGGIETAILEAIAYDIWGNPVPEGLPISFIITDGPGGGESLDTTAYGPYNTVTNSMGKAEVPLQSGTVSGSVRIRAFHNTILSNATQIIVSAGPPAQIVIGTEFCNIDYWDNVGEEVGIVAVVSDVYMNPVTDNTAVYFTTDEGTMKSHEARTKNLEGVVTTKWISGTNVPTADGIVEVICETAGGTVADTSYFINSHLPSTIEATGMPATMEADGVSKAVVWVSAVDLNGNFVINGTPFDADANYLLVESGTFEDGCNISADRVKITSATLNQDYSLTGGQDDGIGAIDYVSYWSGGAFVSYPVQLLTGRAYTPNCEVTNGPTNVAPGEQARFTIEVKDRYGNPLGDHTIVMSAASGTVSGATQETNGNGEATGFVWTAGAGLGDVNITFTDTDPRGGVVITHKVTIE